jgi:hypothetical protein
VQIDYIATHLKGGILCVKIAHFQSGLVLMAGEIIVVTQKEKMYYFVKMLKSVA